MKPKKTKKADLNNYSFTFMLIGLVVVLFITLKVINMKTYASDIDLDTLSLAGSSIEQTEVIEIEQPKPEVKIEKPKELVDLDIKKDEEKVEESLVQTSEDVPDEPVLDPEALETEEVEEIEIPVYDVGLVQQVPVYPGCEKYAGNNEKLQKCMNEKLRKLVANKFNTDIAYDLGLSNERVKILTQFTIDKDGRITDIRTRSKYKDLEKEAERVIKSFPKMQPGKQRYRPVKVRYTLPIIFKVSEE